jgi:hypothetical protein
MHIRPAAWHLRKPIAGLLQHLQKAVQQCASHFSKEAAERLMPRRLVQGCPAVDIKAAQHL